MVIVRNPESRGGWLVIDLAVAVMILGLAMLPLAFSFNSEQKLLRANYNRAIAMEIVDGEMEVLRAGAWRKITEGEHDYAVNARAATNLPAGNFLTRRSTATLRLEWRPAKRTKGGSVSREMLLPKSEQ